MNYSEYLKIDKIISSQEMESVRIGKPAHDEMLFIITHQAYELWFKQMLHELDSVLTFFKSPSIEESSLGVMVSRLSRINKIMGLLIDQISVLETMTPLDFLEFRNLLVPASGFQSAQFRLLEVKLGLRKQDRTKFNQQDFDQLLDKKEKSTVNKAEEDINLVDGLDRWLSRTPFLEQSGFNFWQNYQKAVEQMFKDEFNRIENDQHLDAAMKDRQRQQVTASRAQFETLFNEDEFNKAKAQGLWRLSFQSLKAALLIQLYRNQPILHLPYRIMAELIDLDEHLTNWRQRHALMAKRMLGLKTGTGGSSGAQYLKEAADNHRVFQDLLQLTTFFIPTSKLPQLPKEFLEATGFHWDTKKI